MSKITEFLAPTPPAAPSRAIELDEQIIAAPESETPAIETLEAEARALSPGEPQPLANLFWLDDRLATLKGSPRYSPWGRFAYTEFYRRNAEQPSVTAFNMMLGRGGGKSSNSQKFCAAEAMLTARVVPIGERWLFPFVSLPQEAIARIRGLAETIDVFGVGAKLVLSPRAKLELCDLRGNEIQIVALPCTVAGMSGPTLMGWVFDEAAKWAGHDRSKVNPSGEIHISAIAACRGRLVRTLNISSAWFQSGFHYEAIQRGNTATSHVARIGPAFLDEARAGFLRVAAWEFEQRHDNAAAQVVRAVADSLTADSTGIPTWLGNPTIDPVITRAKVQDLSQEQLKGFTPLAYWLREWGSVPMSIEAAGRGCSLEYMRGILEINQSLARASANRRGGQGLSTYRAVSTLAPDKPMIPDGWEYDGNGVPYRSGGGWGSGRGGACL